MTKIIVLTQDFQPHCTNNSLWILRLRSAAVLPGVISCHIDDYQSRFFANHKPWSKARKHNRTWRWSYFSYTLACRPFSPLHNTKRASVQVVIPS